MSIPSVKIPPASAIPPKNLGAIGNSVYALVNGVTSAGKAFASNFKIPSSPTAGSTEPTKFDKVVPSVNLSDIGNDMFEVEYSVNCEQVMKKIEMRTDKLKIKLASLTAPFDNLFKDFEEFIKPILDFLGKLSNPMSLLTTNPLQIIPYLVNIFKFICMTFLYPIVKPIDLLYIAFRNMTNSIAVVIVKHSSVGLKLRCVDECTYGTPENPYTNCRVCQKLNKPTCPLKPMLSYSASIESAVVGPLDAILAPVNIVFTVISNLLKPLSAVGLAPRTFPPQVIASIIGDIRSKAKNAANTTPDVQPEIFPTELPEKVYALDSPDKDGYIQST